MMSLRAVHAGAGYQYLLRSVATNDAADPTVTDLEDGQDGEATALSNYYQAKGTPPGRWLGSGLQGFDHKKLVTGALVDEQQMANLYGMGLHPEASEIWAVRNVYRDAQLGRAFRISTNDIPVLNALRAAEKSFVREHQRTPTAAERSEMAVTVGTPFYCKATGYTSPASKDVVAWINQQQTKVTQAVSAFDFTFSPTKSVSVLWALADEKTANAIAACHHEAVAEVIAWTEREVARTRVGANGIAQVKTRGLIGAEFTHFDTRTGDPDLHSHVLISNKVQTEDGRWLSLDGQEIFHNHQAISARYDAVLMEKLTRKLGLEFYASSRADAVEPVWEVSGVPEELNALFSSRKELARPVFDQMVADYIEAYGKQPDKQVQRRLWQEAILATRDEKKPAQSLDTLRTQWADRVRELNGGDELLGIVRNLVNSERLTAAAEPTRPEFTDSDVDDAAAVVLARVTDKRGIFGENHVRTATATLLKGYRFPNAKALDDAIETVVSTVLTNSVALAPAEVLMLPEQLRGDNNRGVDFRKRSERYTTQEILDGEQRVLNACEQPTAVVAANATIDAALAAHEKANGWTLNEGQEAMARSLLTSGALVACGVGPAGTGKTTSMQIVNRVWQDEGRKVIGLAPSAKAAAILGEEIGVDATTIDALTFVWRGGHPTKPAHDPSALPVDIQPGDMLLVDEAGMASTQNLAALVEIAEATGAVVRMIGDPHQLRAVGAGGVFGYACKQTNAVELTHVMRFDKGRDTAQADASLQLRKGDKKALDYYFSNGRVSAGTREAQISRLVDDFFADRELGRRSMMIATTNADVDRLNEMVRTRLIADGVVSPDPEDTVTAGRGHQVSTGDVVIARKNQTFFAHTGGRRVATGKVLNGQMFRIVGTRADGSLDVADTVTGKRMLLPADYVADNIHLGYAATVHRAQGATVDVCRSLVDTSMNRPGLYVAMTRGKKENHAYCVTDNPFDFDAEDAHFHMAGVDPERDAKKILLHVLANTQGGETASEIRDAERTHAVSRKRLEELYRFGVDEAHRVLAESVAGRIIDLLPPEVEKRLEREERGRERLIAALALNSAAGGDIRHIAPSVVNYREWDTADSVGAVLGWRVEKATQVTTQRTTGLVAPPPQWVGEDVELCNWLRDTFVRLSVETKAQPAPEFSPGDVVEGALLDGSHARNRTIEDVRFVNCDLTDFDFSGCTLRHVTFEGCALDRARFTDAKLVDVEFEHCSAADASFEGATLGTFPAPEDIDSIEDYGVRLRHSCFDRARFMWTKLRVFVAFQTSLIASRFNSSEDGVLMLDTCDVTDSHIVVPDASLVKTFDCVSEPEIRETAKQANTPVHAATAPDAHDYDAWDEEVTDHGDDYEL
ncbi:MobF family relaxase [Corynebacterium sp. 13CS0277]|uniref:MobF family relaxase n=1 Tax=Corynebacterium sp. 13CS0277 TaxID=2071994 RepID=UPI001304D7E9|nr:MobF family relaxase [Corynebacterium sp. 13CS0277]